MTNSQVVNKLINAGGSELYDMYIKRPGCAAKSNLGI